MRTTLALLIVALLIPAVLISITLTAVSITVTPSGILGILHRADAGKLTQDALVATIRTSDIRALTERFGISKDALVTLAPDILPADQLTVWMDSAVPQIFAWLNGSASNPSIILDTSAEKVNLGQVLTLYLDRIADSMPVCPVDRSTIDRSRALPLCRPANLSPMELRNQVSGPNGTVANLLTSIPNSVDLMNLAPAAAAVTGKAPRIATLTNTPELERIRGYYRALHRAVPFAWAVVVVLLLLLTSLKHYPQRSLFRWLGIALFAAGILPAVLGTVLVFGAALSLLPPTTDMPPEVAHAITVLAQTFADAVGRLPLALGAAFLLAGTALFTVSVLHHHPTTPHAGIRRH
jgi:hypothetical protein